MEQKMCFRVDEDGSEYIASPNGAWYFGRGFRNAFFGNVLGYENITDEKICELLNSIRKKKAYYCVCNAKTGYIYKNHETPGDAIAHLYTMAQGMDVKLCKLYINKAPKDFEPFGFLEVSYVNGTYTRYDIKVLAL